VSGIVGVGRSMLCSHDRLTLHSRRSRNPIPTPASLACDCSSACTGRTAMQTVRTQVRRRDAYPFCWFIELWDLRCSGTYTAYIGSWSPTFRDDPSVQCSWILFLWLLDRWIVGPVCGYETSVSTDWRRDGSLKSRKFTKTFDVLLYNLKGGTRDIIFCVSLLPHVYRFTMCALLPHIL